MLQSTSNQRLFEAMRKDGSSAFIQIGITLIQNTGGQTRYVVAMVDNTELLRLNEALTQSNKHLQERVAEVESLKTNQSHLLHVISHELKSPLHVTTSLLELLSDAQSTRLERAEFSRELSGQIDYVLTSIRLLIDYADYQESRFSLNLEPLNIRSWFQSCLGMVLNTHPDAASRVYADCQCESSQFVLADRLRLQSILVGLLSNALKHAKADRISVQASLSSSSPPVLHLTVSDNGIGLEQGILDRVFEPLANLEQRRNMGSGGLGIGLSMYRAYLDSMGGHIQIHSGRSGQGTQVDITVPLAMYEAGFEVQATSGQNSEMPLQGLRVLLTDDDKMIVKVVGLRLKRLGAQVWSAYNGLEALELVRAQESSPFDLILMDLNMPVMDGFEAARQIRQIKSHQQTPIFAVTAAVESDAFPKAMQAGMNGCYSKPFDPALLVSVITRR